MLFFVVVLASKAGAFARHPARGVVLVSAWTIYARSRNLAMGTQANILRADSSTKILFPIIKIFFATLEARNHFRTAQWRLLRRLPD
jgi:hypothetical protein